MLCPLVVTLLFGLASSAPADEGTPLIRRIELKGVTVYSTDETLRIVRLREGDPLRREPGLVAQSLETRYHDDGYPAARVAGSYDAEGGTLLLAADEGKLAEVVIEGLSPRGAASALAEAGLTPGTVLREEDIGAAFDRIADASHGALRVGEHRIEPGPEGVRLVLKPERAHVALAPLIGAGDLRSARRFNRVDGFNPALGIEVTVLDAVSYNHLRAYAVGDYGFSSEKLRHAEGVTRPFLRGQRLTLGYEHHDLTATDDLYRAPGLEEAPGTAIILGEYADYFRRQGHEAYAFVRLGSRSEVGLSWRGDDYSSLPVATGSSDPNPPITEGRMRSLVATARFTSAGDLHPSASSERASFLQRDLYGVSQEPPRALRAEATFEVASPDALGGDFDFRRFIANLRGHVALSHRTALDARLLVGLTSGTVPLEKRFSLGGVGTLRGYALKAFPGGNITLVTAEGRVDPGRWWPRFAVFYDGGDAWDSGVTGAGWKSSVGAGIKWPAAAAVFVRVDVARAVGDPQESKVRVGGRVQIPF
jgi:surface antigen Omp85-like protein/surface antigen-like variable number repeat protein